MTKNFATKELVPPEVYAERGEAASQLMDKRIVDVAQWISDKTGKDIIVNGTLAGHIYTESGLRNFNTTTGAKWSQHKYGRALDLKVVGMTPEEGRQLLKDNWEELKAIGLTCIEKDTPGWVHIDCRYTGLDYLLEVPYK